MSAWFSGVLPLDGRIYVASLGSAFDVAEDAADGVVVVDGATGQAAYFFVPEGQVGRGPRDVVGIAAGPEGLYVACRDGQVYLVRADGSVSWALHAGSGVVGAPLAWDFNGDGVLDVMVATQAGRVVAVSGRSGRTAWVAEAAEVSVADDALGASLAVGDVHPASGDEVVVTYPGGGMAVLAARTGRVLWRDALPMGSVGGAVCVGEGEDGGPRSWVGDRAGTVWALWPAGAGGELGAGGGVVFRAGETLIAGVRTLRAKPETPVLTVACPTTGFTAGRSAVAALDAVGLVWRLPVEGTIWGTPAVADVGGDAQPEIVLGVIETTEEGGVAGAVWVVSAAGHVLMREGLDAAVESSPVVADVDGDGNLEVLVADQGGYLHCYATGHRGPVQWGLLGGDSCGARQEATAFSFGQRPFGYQRGWVPE
jgi:hypothetical protein